MRLVENNRLNTCNNINNMSTHDITLKEEKN